jgi:hypothetical protein
MTNLAKSSHDEHLINMAVEVYGKLVDRGGSNLAQQIEHVANEAFENYKKNEKKYASLKIL